MNNDLISREWIKYAFDNLCCHDCKKCRNFKKEDSFYKCDFIENAPTVEIPDCDTCTFTKPVTMPEWERLTNELNELDKKVKELERPQGEWIDYSDEGYVECPFCQSATTCEDNKDELHYCFNCGAKLN